MKPKNKFLIQPFGKPAIKFIDHADAFFNIAVGAIRSGKTTAAIFKFIAFMGESPYAPFAMAGKTINSLRRNVVEPFLEILNAFNIPYNYNKYEQEITTITKKIALFGIDKLGSDEKIKGFTCAGSLLDEVTVMDPDGVRMLISRNSYPGARIFATCNPTNPNNFIYQEYVNNKNLLNSGECKVFNFRLEDNPVLSKEYIRNIKSMYAPGSVFYKRNILNQWVTGQGAVYDMFNEANIIPARVVDDFIKNNTFERYGVGHDYGVSTTNAYSLVGIKTNPETHRKEFILIDELFFNAEEEGRTQTDTERLKDLIRLQNRYKLDFKTSIHFSHDAGSLKTEAEKNRNTGGGLKLNIKTFKPDTLDCIQKISNLFYEKRFLISDKCKETIKQLQGYEWDIKASNKGIDRPIKKDDHLVDSLRAPIITELRSSHRIGGLLSW